MWTLVERMNTIVTVYHGDPTVKQHYSTSNGEIPTLSTLFPNVAYTEANVIEARSHGTPIDDLSDIEDWNGEEVDDALPDVIPETFL
ncbi:hypothetical protein N0V95_000016 [Ascochyta clinopodiicola]|nr:hypothetical protein N0V95_000016 [Ascochyta clinopodiicola]